MALKYLCDGCDAAGDKADFEEYGPLARIYCKKCAKVITDYHSKRDTLHDRVAAAWNKGLAKIRKEFADKVKMLDDA
jgi:beta-galactosidase GanA